MTRRIIFPACRFAQHGIQPFGWESSNKALASDPVHWIMVVTFVGMSTRHRHGVVRCEIYLAFPSPQLVEAFEAYHRPISTVALEVASMLRLLAALRLSLMYLGCVELHRGARSHPLHHYITMQLYTSSIDPFAHLSEQVVAALRDFTILGVPRCRQLLAASTSSRCGPSRFLRMENAGFNHVLGASHFGLCTLTLGHFATSYSADIKP